MQALALGRMYGDPTQLRDGSLAKYIGSLRVPGTVDYVLSMLRTWFDDMARLETALSMCVNFRRFSCGATGIGPCLWNLLSTCAAASIKSEFELLPGTGHLPYEECPELLTRARELLSGQDARERGRAPAGTATALG